MSGVSSAPIIQEVTLENILSNSGFGVWSNSQGLYDPATGLAPVQGDAQDQIVNGDFLNWTADDPDNWAVTLEDANNYVTEVAGTCRIVSDNTAALKMQQVSAALTAGKLYLLQLTVSSFIAGDIRLNLSGAHSLAFSEMGWGSNGLKTYLFTASSTAALTMAIYRSAGGNTDLVIDNLMLHEVTPGIISGTNGCDGFGVDAGLKQFREHDGANTKDGSFYALKLVSTGVQGLVWNKANKALLSFYKKFSGRTVTYGVWAKTPFASSVRLRLGDGLTNTYSSYHTGGGAYEWLEVTQDISASNTQFIAQIVLAATGQTAYFSQPMLIFGSRIGAGNYSQPKGEIINLDAVLNLFSGASPLAADDKTLDVEALSLGKAPKRCKTLYLNGYVLNSSVAAAAGVRIGPDSARLTDLELFPSVNNLPAVGSARARCDANGDLYQQISAGGNTLSGYRLQIAAVEV